jgi:hypothetical protein
MIQGYIIIARYQQVNFKGTFHDKIDPLERFGFLLYINGCVRVPSTATRMVWKVIILDFLNILKHYTTTVKCELLNDRCKNAVQIKNS